MGAVVFAVVDRPGERPWRQAVVALQEQERVIDGVKTPAHTDMVPGPTSAGIYQWDDTHKYHAARLAAIKAKMARDNMEGQPPRIVGPFKDVTEALMEVQRVRPRTADEKAREAEVKNRAQADEIKALKDKLAAVEAELKARAKAAAGKS